MNQDSSYVGVASVVYSYIRKMRYDQCCYTNDFCMSNVLFLCIIFSYSDFFSLSLSEEILGF